MPHYDANSIHSIWGGSCSTWSRASAPSLGAWYCIQWGGPKLDSVLPLRDTEKGRGLQKEHCLRYSLQGDSFGSFRRHGIRAHRNSMLEQLWQWCLWPAFLTSCSIPADKV